MAAHPTVLREARGQTGLRAVTWLAVRARRFRFDLSGRAPVAAPDLQRRASGKGEGSLSYTPPTRAPTRNLETE